MPSHIARRLGRLDQSNLIGLGARGRPLGGPRERQMNVPAPLRRPRLRLEAALAQLRPAGVSQEYVDKNMSKKQIK